MKITIEGIDLKKYVRKLCNSLEFKELEALYYYMGEVENIVHNKYYATPEVKEEMRINELRRKADLGFLLNNFALNEINKKNIKVPKLPDEITFERGARK